MTTDCEAVIEDYHTIIKVPADSGPFISQSDRTGDQAQIGTDSQEYDISEDDLH